MIAAITSEFRKFFSTRLWWVLTLCMVGYFLLMSGGMAATVGGLSSMSPGDSSLEGFESVVYGIGVASGYVFPVIVGAIGVTAEYRHHTIVPTFLAQPRRLVVMGAKAIAALPMGLAIGVAGTAACLIGGGLGFAITGVPTGLDQASTWRNAGLSVLAFTVWTLVGVGLGLLIISQVGVIVFALAFTQLVEPILRLGMSMMSSPVLNQLAQYLPGAASDSLAGGTSLYQMITVSATTVSGVPPLGVWQGGLVLLGYAVVLGVIGYLVRIRRDVA
ncbi:MAG: ABC transporter permease [Propionibacteriaceae bacterium]|jgi:ABC-type transport system involved in multi-copper enzyme maturation permease subunit|nr:ABC transporter permease [Propionibacteriaceae bacterium]